MFRIVARHCRRLHDDREGQSMPIIAVSLLLLVAFSVAVINTGVHVTERQQMQTAVDASAYSTAAVKAKGMNMIAATNLLLETLMTFRVIVEITRDALDIAATATTPLCPATFGCPIHVALRAVASFFRPIANAAARIINEVIFPAIVLAAQIIRVAIPVLAIVTGFRIAQRNRADGALLWPLIDPLPVSPVSRVALCDRVAQNFENVIGSIPGIGRVLDVPLLGDAITGIIRGLIGLYCDGGAAVAAAGSIDLGENSVREERNCNTCRSANGARDASYRVLNASVTTVTFVFRPDNNDVLRAREESRSTDPMSGADRRRFFRRSGEDGRDYLVRGRPFRCESGAFDHVLSTEGRAPPNPVNGTQFTERTFNARLQFQSCVIEQEVEGDFEPPASTQGGGCDPTPHLLDDGERASGCGVTRGSDYQTMLDDGAFDVAAVAWLDIDETDINRQSRYRPLAEMMGDEGSFYVTLANAQFYSQAEPHDMWHMDWRARLVEFELPGIDLGAVRGAFGSADLPTEFPTELEDTLGNLP